MHAGPGSVGHVAAIVIASFAVMTSQFTGSAPMARNDDGQKKSAVATTTGAAEKRVAEQARQAAGRHRQQSSSGHIPGQSRNRADLGMLRLWGWRLHRLVSLTPTYGGENGVPHSSTRKI